MPSQIFHGSCVLVAFLQGDFKFRDLILSPSVQALNVFDVSKHHQIIGAVHDTLVSARNGEIPYFNVLANEISQQLIASLDIQKI